MKMTKTAWILIFAIIAVLVATAFFSPSHKLTPIRVGSVVLESQKTKRLTSRYTTTTKPPTSSKRMSSNEVTGPQNIDPSDHNTDTKYEDSLADTSNNPTN